VQAYAAILVGTLAFLLRFLGFRGFSNDHYMHLAWSRQLLAGELPGRDFVDPGMPLTYVVSALVQAISPDPFGEVLLTTAALGVAVALVCVIVSHLTGRVTIGVGAALFAIALQPRLYNYPKILVPMIVLGLVSLYAAQPSRLRVAILGAWTVVAALFRYDFGLYTCAAMTAALLAVHWRQPRRLAGAVGSYGLAVALFGVPYAAFVQWSIGLRLHLEEAVEFARSDQHQLLTLWSELPQLEALSPVAWTREDAAAFLCYASYGLVAVSLVLLAARRRHQPAGRTPVVVAGAVLLICYVAFVLRHSLVARIPDLASVLAVMGAWSLFELGRIATAGLSRLQPPRMVVRLAAGAIVAIPLAPVLAGVWSLSNVSEGIERAALMKGWAKMAERAAAVRQSGTVWPWERDWPSGEMPATVRYLDECTRPSDRLLLTWPAPEYYYFARRQFAAGHALLLPPRAFTGASHQARMIARLDSQFVPIVLINESRQDEFVKSYGLLAQYLSERYVASGHYTIYDGSVITVARRRDLHPTSTYGPEAWPCHLEAGEAVPDSASIGDE
jgi:hypothetical protein